jgi:hypothetical protein
MSSLNAHRGLHHRLLTVLPLGEPGVQPKLWDTFSSDEEGWRAERRGGADPGIEGSLLTRDKGQALIMTAARVSPPPV